MTSASRLVAPASASAIAKRRRPMGRSTCGPAIRPPTQCPIDSPASTTAMIAVQVYSDMPT